MSKKPVTQLTKHDRKQISKKILAAIFLHLLENCLFVCCRIRSWCTWQKAWTLSLITFSVILMVSVIFLTIYTSIVLGQIQCFFFVISYIQDLDSLDIVATFNLLGVRFKMHEGILNKCPLRQKNTKILFFVVLFFSQCAHVNKVSLSSFVFFQTRSV